MEEGEVRKLHCLWIGICVTVLAGQFESGKFIFKFSWLPT